MANITIVCNKVTKQHYVGYRRRGADEIKKPGVAECIIRFCRVHRSTVLDPGIRLDRVQAQAQPPVQSHPEPERPQELSLSQSQSHSSEEKIEEVEDVGTAARFGVKSTLRRKINAENAQKGAALLRRGLGKGLVTGAGLAKRVASTGRSRLMRTNSSGNGNRDTNEGEDLQRMNTFESHPHQHQDDQNHEYDQTHSQSQMEEDHPHHPLKQSVTGK